MDLRDTVDEAAKRTEWRLDRVAWAAIAVVVALAAAGLFGGGPLAKRSVAREADGAAYEMQHEGFNRKDHVSLLFVRVDAPGTSGDTLSVALSPEVTAAVTVRSSVPSADGGQLGPEGAVYTFQVEDWGSPLLLSFEYLPEAVGPTRGVVLVTAGERAPVPLPFSQFVFP